MNAGAAAAQGTGLLFLHADARLPPQAHQQMSEALDDVSVALLVDGPARELRKRHETEVEEPEQRTGELALVELTKEPGAAKARVTAAGYITTWVDVGAVHRVAEAPASLVSRVLPSGNRVFVSELPKLPRSCEAGSDVVASWGAPPKVTIAMLPLPPDAPLPRTPKTGVAERDDLKPPPAAVAVSEAPQRLVDVIPPPPASPEPAPPVAQKAPSTDSKPAGKASPQVAAAPATVHGTRVTALATNNVQNGQKAKPGFIAVSTASHRPKRILAAVTPVSGTVLTVTRHNQTSRQ